MTPVAHTAHCSATRPSRRTISRARSGSGRSAGRIVASCTWLVFCILDPNAPLDRDHLERLQVRRPLPEHHRQRRRHGRARLVAEVPRPTTGSRSSPPLGVGARLVRGLSRSASTTSRCPALTIWAFDRSVRARTTSRSSSSRSPDRCCCPPAAYSFASGCARPGPRRPRSRSRRSARSMQTRNDWQIYGGNIASTLAGEFSFTIALALGAVRTRRAGVHARHGQATLVARAAHRGGDHVAHRRRDRSSGSRRSCCGSRAARCARGGSRCPVGARRGTRSPRVWLLPLLWNAAYTQSMRYTKLLPNGNASSSGRGSRCRARSATRSNGIVERVGDLRSIRHAQARQAQPLVAAVVDLVARRGRDRLPRAGTAGVRRSCCSCSRWSIGVHVRASGPSTRSGTPGSCRSGC